MDRSARKGVIETVKFSKWAARIVPVLKSDRKIRICGDYKTTINQASQTEFYPLPKINDYLQNWLGEGISVDLSHAYQQLKLDDKSKEYVSTHIKGLIRYTRLPFVASAPAIFQHAMDSVLQGISGVHLGDILVSGKTEK